MKKLVVVADWASDSMNFQEFISAVEGYLKDPKDININFVTSDPSTIHTGFVLAQVILTEERLGHPAETVIFQNTDTRLNVKEQADSARGAEFLIIRLKSGLYVCGPNAGYDFSFIKPNIDEVFKYEGLDKGSQFRSRDLYARVSAHLMDGLEDEMDLIETLNDVIPSITGYYIGHIDNHGNVKTTITLSDVREHHEYGEEIIVKINGIEKKAAFVKNLFGGTPGQLVIYPGSSGPLDNPYLEVSIWRYFTEKNPTTGVDVFNNPRPGMEIQFV